MDDFETELRALIARWAPRCTRNEIICALEIELGAAFELLPGPSMPAYLALALERDQAEGD